MITYTQLITFIEWLEYKANTTKAYNERVAYNEVLEYIERLKNECNNK